MDLRAFVDAALHELLDLGELLLGVDRADVGVLVERVADAQDGEAALEAGEHVLGDAFLDQQARAGAADVALVEEDAVDDAFDGLVDRGVVEDDVGRLAAEFEGELFAGAGERVLDDLADFGGAGEGDLGGERMVDHGGSGFARAGDDVDDAGRQSGIR